MDFNDYEGAPVFDKDNNKIGSIADMYYTEDENRPVWATVKSGLFGMKKHFVPLEGATLTEEGVTLPNVTEDMVKNAPGIENDDEITDEDDSRLSNYYRYQDESANGRLDAPDASEEMPHVGFDGEQQETAGSSQPRRYTLHKYVVKKGGKKWQEEVFVERTLVDDNTDTSDSVVSTGESMPR